jgi:hypothetical protein
MARNTHVVFTSRTATAPKRRVTFGVYIDLDELARLALRISHNKGRKGKDGPIHVEIHSIEPIS